MDVAVFRSGWFLPEMGPSLTSNKTKKNRDFFQRNILPALLNHKCAKAQQETPKAQLQQKTAQVRRETKQSTPTTSCACKTCSICHRPTTKILKPTRKSLKCSFEKTIFRNPNAKQKILTRELQKICPLLPSRQQKLRKPIRKPRKPTPTKNCASPTRNKTVMTISPSSSTKTFYQ